MRRHRFTLTEVLVALAILGILMAIAVPHSRGPTASALAADARRILFETASQLEWCLLQTHDAVLCAADLQNQDGHYGVTVELLETGFRLRASARHPLARQGPCPELTLERGGQPEPLDC